MNKFLLFFSGIIALATACTTSNPVGADILSQDFQEVKVTEDFDLKTFTVRGDSTITFELASSRQLPEYLVGEYIDPIFGSVRSSIYAQLGIDGLKPDFRNTEPDSIVLVLPYAVDFDYGKIDDNYTLSVLRVIEPIDTIDGRVYSDRTFETEMNPLGEITFTPMNTEEDSVTVQSPNTDGDDVEDTRLPPQLRIPLSSDFVEEIFSADSLNFIDTEAFLELLNGLHIRSETVNEGLFAFDLLANINAGLFVYYSEEDEDQEIKKRQYRFNFGSAEVKCTNYVHDYSGSVAEEFLDSDEDSLMFVQGLAGLAGVIQLPDLDFLRGEVSIAKAELTLTVADLGEDTEESGLTPTSQLITNTKNENDVTIITEDVFNASSSAGFNPALIGGSLIDGVSNPDTYVLNITAYLQNVLNDKSSDRLIIQPYQRQRFPDRVVFYGGNHSEFAPKLKVYYTEY